MWLAGLPARGSRAFGPTVPRLPGPCRTSGIGATSPFTVAGAAAPTAPAGRIAFPFHPQNAGTSPTLVRFEIVDVKGTECRGSLLELTVHQLHADVPPERARKLAMLGYRQWLGGLPAGADYVAEARRALAKAAPFAATAPGVRAVCAIIALSIARPLAPLDLALPASRRRADAPCSAPMAGPRGPEEASPVSLAGPCTGLCRLIRRAASASAAPAAARRSASGAAPLRPRVRRAEGDRSPRSARKPVP